MIFKNPTVVSTSMLFYFIITYPLFLFLITLSPFHNYNYKYVPRTSTVSLDIATIRLNI